MADDRLAAELQEIRERRENAEHSFLLAPTEAGRACVDSAEDVPRLLAAVEAVLADHRITSGGGDCSDG